MGSCCSRHQKTKEHHLHPNDFSEYLPTVLARLTYEYGNEWKVGDRVKAYLKSPRGWYDAYIFRVDCNKHEVGLRFLNYPIRIGYYKLQSQYLRPACTPD